MVATVQFRAASALDIQAGSTTTSVTIPASVQVGDYLVLHVVHRDTLTPPAGWSVLEGPTTAVAANQMQSVLVRVAQSGDASSSVTCTQASSQRMLSHVQAFYSTDGQQVIASDIAAQVAAGLDLPALSATYPGQMAVVSMGNVYAISSGVETITPPAGYTQTTPSAVEQNRLGAAYKSLADAETIAGRFENESGDTDRTAFSLILGATLSRTEPAGTLVTLEQEVISGTDYPAATLATLRQVVLKEYVLRGAATLAALSQTVEYSTQNAAQALVTLQQSVTTSRAAGTLIGLRQIVLSVQEAAQNRMFVALSGQDISQNVAPTISITATEGDNRTASLRLVALPAGPLDIPSYQGKAVVITRLINGSLVTLFRGTVERPVWDRDNRQLVLECSDLRNERVGKEDQDRLKAMTGGLYSPITQREGATGEQWVRELLKTVPGSLNYTGDGVLQYKPWAVAAPRYTLTDSDVYYEDIRLEFATRSEVVNVVPATLEYRYSRRNTVSFNVNVSMRMDGGTGLPRPGDIIPTKEAIRGAFNGMGDWRVLDSTLTELPPNGWYRDTASAFVQRVAWTATPEFRATRAMGGSATLARYISQPQREVYQLRIEAPESIDQYGEIPGSDVRVSVETGVDGDVYEERGCAVIEDPDDRRADVDYAIQAIQRMAERQILASHRKNFAEITYKAEILPVEIGDTVSLATSEFDAVGTVTEFQHATTRSGDYYTSLKLAVSRVDSAVSVTEDWSLPAPPDRYALNADSVALPDAPDCPAPTGAAEVSGPSRIEPDGSVIITAPAVDRSQVDEIIGTRTHTYNVKIPVDTFTVEVPA